MLGGFSEESRFEFVELVNISSSALDLREVALQMVPVGGGDQGVSFAFANSGFTLLGAGERVIVANDAAAFVARYGEGLPVAGSWSGTLSNNREQLTLAWGETVVQQFTYDDAWHPSTDGSGPSLELIDAQEPDLASWGEAGSWQPSSVVGGTPGVSYVLGDYTADNSVDAGDIDAISAALRSGRTDRVFDLTGDRSLSDADRTALIETVLGTVLGDADLDGVVGTADGEALLAHLGQAAGWSSGDFDGDGMVTGSRDGALLLAGLAADAALASEASWDPQQLRRSSTWE